MFPMPFLSWVKSFCLDEVQDRGYVCWVVEKTGEAWIWRIQDLLLSLSLGIVTSTLSIIENLGVLLNFLEAYLIKFIE